MVTVVTVVTALKSFDYFCHHLVTSHHFERIPFHPAVAISAGARSVAKMMYNQ